MLQGAHDLAINNSTFILNEPPPRERPGEPWGNFVSYPDERLEGLDRLLGHSM